MTGEVTASNAGRMAANILHFGRVLRAAGLPVGTGRILDAIEAVETVGIGTREDLFWTLHAVLVNRQDQRALFDQAFHIFWRNPDILKQMLSVMLPRVRVDRDRGGEMLVRRVAEALQAPDPGSDAGIDDAAPTELRIDATLTWSAHEQLRTKDFEQMSIEELALAKAALHNLRLPLPEVATRRFAPHPAGPRIDMRNTLRRTVRSGGTIIDLAHKKMRRHPPPLVVLCDISGSMDRYARMVLHFLHAVTNDRDRVHSFLFGTRLTNISRHLRHKDVDVALKRVADAVVDWSGGTRIGLCLDAFNRLWGRRVLAQGAVVLLITDGLDRDGADGLDRAMDRLHRSCRRLIWLNPLLRFDGFAPKSAGIRAMLPHVDDFRPAHNLSSLTTLTEALGTSPLPTAEASLRAWREEARQ